MIANNPIQCEKEYLRKDVKYMQRERERERERERTHTRIAMNKREKTHSRRWYMHRER